MLAEEIIVSGEESSIGLWTLSCGISAWLVSGGCLWWVRGELDSRMWSQYMSVGSWPPDLMHCWHLFRLLMAQIKRRDASSCACWVSGQSSEKSSWRFSSEDERSFSRVSTFLTTAVTVSGQRPENGQFFKYHLWYYNEWRTCWNVLIFVNQKGSRNSLKNKTCTWKLRMQKFKGVLLTAFFSHITKTPSLELSTDFLSLNQLLKPPPKTNIKTLTNDS